MRISSYSLKYTVQDAVSDARERLQQTQQQVATGNPWAKRSEAPADAVEYSRLGRDQQANTKWQENAAKVALWEQVTEGRVDQAVDAMQRIHELLVEAGNDTETARRATLAKELDGIIDDLADLANSRYDGAYLFAGTKGDAPPFTVTSDADGTITAVTYVGNDTRRQAQLDDNVVEAYGVAGGGNGGLFADTATGTDIFASLIELRDQLANNEFPAQTTQTKIENGLQHVIDHYVDTGLREKRVADVQDLLVDREVVTRERRSALRDVDTAAALTELGQLQSSYQAALQMAARVNQLSMVNVL